MFVNAGDRAGRGRQNSGSNIIASQIVVGSSTTQITFDSLPTTYNNLKLVIVGRTLATDNAVGNFGIIFNSDTTAAHYPSTLFTGSPGSGSVASGTAYGAFGNNFASSTAGNTHPSCAAVDIFLYAQISNFVTWQSLCTGSSYSRVMNTGSFYSPSSLVAITSITLTAINNSLVVANWAAGTTFILYGY